LLFGYTFPTTWACSGLTPVRARPWRANKESGGSENQSRRNLEMAREDTSALRRLFSFAVVRQIIVLFFTYMLYGKFVDFIKI